MRLSQLEKLAQQITGKSVEVHRVEDLPGGAIGMSWQQSPGQYVVALKSLLWTDIPLSMPLTFYHELGHILAGHCVLPGQKSLVPYHREESEAIAWAGRLLATYGDIRPLAGIPTTSAASGDGDGVTVAGYLVQWRPGLSKSASLDNDYLSSMDYRIGVICPAVTGDESPIGVIDLKTARRDDRGLFVERVLSRRQKYVDLIVDLIKRGRLQSHVDLPLRQEILAPI
jgi:hypothetical protein